jgi:protein-S-isoprenylcysteine O-methyltransferase Ste14
MMRAWPTELIIGIWVVWFVFWRVAALGVKPVERQESVGSRLSYLLPMFIVILLMLWQDWPGWLGTQLLSGGWVEYWLSVALIVAGLAWTVWARKTLGGNWSGRVTVKSGHELVRSGPYRWIRHPIYTGGLLALLGSALASGVVAGFVGFAVAICALVYKLRIEERWMLGQFGESYRDYRRVSWALVPFIY